MIEAALGFGVVPDPKSGAYVSTLKSPSIVFERLSKEEVKVADGPLRLLETMDLDISFRKVLTRKCTTVPLSLPQPHEFLFLNTAIYSTSVGYIAL